MPIAITSLSHPHRHGLFNRRAFLGATTFLTAACRAIAAPPPRRTPAPDPYRIGCYTRPWDDHELPRALDGIAEAGYRYVGIMTARGPSRVVMTPHTTPEAAARVGELARARGLAICSIYGEFSARSSVAEGVRQLGRLIDHCATCASPGLLLGGTSDAAELPGYYQAIKESCPAAQEHRVTLFLKPHGGLNATGAQCRELIEKVGHPSFRLWYDPGNIYYYSDGARDPLEDVTAVDGIVGGMSIKDFLPPKEVMVTPGTGRVNFTVLLARLRMGGFTQGPLVVECTARGDYAQVTAAAAQARKFVENLARVRGLDNVRGPGTSR